MKEPEIQNQAGKITDDVADYVNLRIASVKLAFVEGLSKVSGNALRIVIIILFFSMAFMAFAIALISWLATVIGSTALAALIVGVVFVIIGLIFTAVKKVFINPMVRMYSGMIFKPRKHEDDENV